MTQETKNQLSLSYVITLMAIAFLLAIISAHPAAPTPQEHETRTAELKF